MPSTRIQADELMSVGAALRAGKRAGTSKDAVPEEAGGSMRRTRTIICAVALSWATVTVGVGPAAQAKPSESVSGSVLSGPCAEPSARNYDPATGSYECDALVRLDGTWTGTGTIHSKGHVNPLTGDATGSVDERLDIKTADGRAGQLHLVGTIKVNGTTGEEVVRVRIVGASGAFRRYAGSVSSTGYSPITGGPATGSYSGRWGRA